MLLESRLRSRYLNNRRNFIQSIASMSIGGMMLLGHPRLSGKANAHAGSPTKTPRIINKTLLYKSEPGSTVWANSFYTRAEGLEKVCVMSVSRASDVHDDWRRRFSSDNGRIWSEWEPIERFKQKTPDGVRRQNPYPGWVDPSNGRMLVMVIDGVLPNDKPLEGMTNWKMRYRVSTDGGRTFAVDRQVIQKGDYTPEHPVEGLWVGKNSMMMGATACRSIRTCVGEILVPVQITPLDPNGRYWRPGGGYTYHDAAVLIGRWRDDLTIEWDVSERVVILPIKSTRGQCEPTVVEMPDRRILMVCRGSNDANPQLPGYKWYSVSEDGGHTWSNPPRPWTYTDGSRFYSPSSCSQLLKHGNGSIYWIGNITPENPRGNGPRYPLVIGRVDPVKMLLIKESVTVIDTKEADDDASLQLSNFTAVEDRETGEIILHLTRFTSKPKPWRGDAYVYRIEP